MDFASQLKKETIAAKDFSGTFGKRMLCDYNAQDESLAFLYSRGTTP